MKDKERISSLPFYNPSKRAWDVAVRGRIVAPEENPQQFLHRVVNILFSPEDKFGTKPETKRKIAEEFASYIVDGYVLPGSPTLTNAGRYENALSSCVVIPVDLREKKPAAAIIKSYYQQNMGSGFDLTPYENPVELLKWINDLSAQETATGNYDRYIGNMGSLHVSHPQIEKFIRTKRDNDTIKHFNISVDVTEEFMGKAENGETFLLTDGSLLNATALLYGMAENAWQNGDPGLIFLERMNRDNPISGISKYVTTPPCSEMGLAEGETCQFGYINLAKFTLVKSNGQVGIDYEKLNSVTRLLTRVLDNAIEYSTLHYPAELSTSIALLKRKIGIGVCGLADMLITYGLPYDSLEAKTLCRDILSFINYASKVSSVELASERGSCLAMLNAPQNAYISGRFLEDKYATNPTRTVSSLDWQKLADSIRSTGKLRNILTTSLPPTGRASILLDSTPAIESIFTIFEENGNIKTVIIDFLSRTLGHNLELLTNILNLAQQTESFQNVEILPTNIRNVFKTAKEILPADHLSMVSVLAGMHGVIDEAASKTVNLPNTATVEDVNSIFILAYNLGLKNISAYRDGTKEDQPEKL